MKKGKERWHLLPTVVDHVALPTHSESVRHASTAWVTDFSSLFCLGFIHAPEPNWHNFHSHHLTRTYKHAHALNAWAIKGHAGWVLLCCSDCYSERQRPRV